MERINKLVRLMLAFSLAVAVLVVCLPTQAATYRQGSTGSTVRTIQTKLKRWGYYTGTVDGVYGRKTVDAVKYFQRANGLTADGVCGARTLSALGISATGSSSSSGTASRDDDFTLLCRMISAEARGEPYTGQVAVGAVILNRVRHPSFPNTVADRKSVV